MDKRPKDMSYEELRDLPDYYEDIKHPCKGFASTSGDDLAFAIIDGRRYSFTQTDQGWAKVPV